MNNDFTVSFSAIDELGNGGNSSSIEVTPNFDESAKMFSDEMLSCVINGVYAPPTNMTPRVLLIL
jgi:hypothetical protein